MTKKRKQKLEQLLNETMMNLEIRGRSGLLPIEVYRTYLQQRWTSYSEDALSVVMRFDPHIVNETTKSKLLDFIKVEFAPFIYEDRIQSASFFIARGGPVPGFPLDSLLKQLLKITIVRGIAGTVSAFDRCAEDTHVSFQYVALLEGIRLQAEIKAFEGIRLVPLPNSLSELPRVLPGFLMRLSDMSENFYRSKTLLIIDGSVSPIFHKPLPKLFLGVPEDDLPFQVEVSGEKILNFKVADFYVEFCHALSIACNSAVEVSLEWRFLAEDELCNLNALSFGGMSWKCDIALLRSFTEAEGSQIDEAKRLYHILVNLDSKVREKLRIPIDRWIKSKTSGDPVDKMIDLGIAFESIYLSDIKEKTELSFRLRLYASWHLGRDKEDRKALMTEFRAIYNCRSDAVHKGRLNEKVKIGEEHIPISEFVARAQDLCRKSIMKILENGRFPDWNDLILGSEVESEAVGLDENLGGLG